MKLCLLFHGLGKPPAHVDAREALYWLTEERFAHVLDCAKRTANRIAITFDDGNESDLTIALPLLQRAGMTASFYIPTDRIGTKGYLDEDGIRALRNAGMGIGSHGCAHIEWTKAPDADVVHDVMHSVERLEAILDEPVRSVAVPFGECDLRVLRLLRGLGIERVYTSFRGPQWGERWLVRRDCMLAEMDETAIEGLLMRRYGFADAGLSFLRSFRHVGRAALWPAGQRGFNPFEIQYEQPSPPLSARHAPWGTPLKG